MAPSAQLLLGSIGADHVLVVPTRYELPDHEDYWDGNWVYADVTIVSGAFRGGYDALLRTEDFVGFRGQLGALFDRLGGEAGYETMEHWLRISVIGDGRGHMLAKCVARDEPGMGSQLEFEIGFDQTFVPAILRDLDELIRRFPVRGRPE